MEKMYSSDPLVGNELSAEIIPSEEPQEFALEDMESQPSMKVLRRDNTQPSFFGSWFNFIPPNKVIREDEYFSSRGQALGPDVWTSEEKLDAYLGYNPASSPKFLVEESAGKDSESRPHPPRLSLDLNYEDFESSEEFSIEGDYEYAENRREEFERTVSESGDSDWSLSTISLDEAGIDILPMEKEMSDWNGMPPLLSNIVSEELGPVPITREQSDWTTMPPKLPPLLEDTKLEAPAFEPMQSDWSVMPKLFPPLMQSYTSDPGDYIPMPESVVPPIEPQHAGTWTSNFIESDALPSVDWLKTTPTSFEQLAIAPAYGLDTAAASGAHREMEILSNRNVAQPPLQSMPPVLYHNGGSYPPIAGHVNAPIALQPQHALVQYQPNTAYPGTLTSMMPHPNNNLVVARQPAANDMVVARQPSMPAQFSFYYFGGEYNLILCHVPIGMFITPSKTTTEVLLHLVFPVIYVHFTGRIDTGYAHSYMTMDASLLQHSYYYDYSGTSMWNQNVYTDVTQVN